MRSSSASSAAASASAASAASSAPPSPLEQTLATLTRRVLQTQDFRDEEDAVGASLEVGRAVALAWTQPRDALVDAAHAVFVAAEAFPEHAGSAFGEGPTHAGVALARAGVVGKEAEVRPLADAVARVGVFGPRRGEVVRRVVGCLAWEAQRLAAVSANSPAEAEAIARDVVLVRVALVALRRFIAVPRPATAAAKPFEDAMRELIEKVLVPLHQAHGRATPSTSVLGTYHAELSQVVRQITHVSPALLEAAIVAVTGAYPAHLEGNSPKELLFLHELEFLVRERKHALSDVARAAVVGRLAIAVTSLHATVCERALEFFKSDDVLAALQGKDNLVAKQCAGAIARTALTHWSNTVKTMAGAALSKISASSASSTASSTTSTPTTQDPTIKQALQAAAAAAARAAAVPPPKPAPIPKTFSSTTVVRDAVEPFARGAFGRLWKARAIVMGKGKAEWPLIALKEMDDAELARREIEALARVGVHPNVASLLGVFPTKAGVSLVLEYVDGGDLHTAVVQRGSLASDVAAFLAGEVGAALLHIHAQGVAFGDVKPENVLLTGQGHAKLCDFGSAVVMGSGKPPPTLLGGTIEYLAPEQAVSVEADWWAFGCLVHFVLSGRPPVFFSEGEGEGDLSLGHRRAVAFADSVSKSEKGHLKDANARVLVAALCARDPSKRPVDGGESLAFFDGARPWKDLSKKQPPALVQGVAAIEAGPWTRRTFSVMIAPMPSSYASGGLSNTSDEAFWNAVELSSVAPDAAFDSAASWLGGPALDPAHVRAIPQVRELVPVSLGGGASVPSHAAVFPQQSSTQQKYVVAGVDLTAG